MLSCYGNSNLIPYQEPRLKTKQAMQYTPRRPGPNMISPRRLQGLKKTPRRPWRHKKRPQVKMADRMAAESSEQALSIKSKTSTNWMAFYLGQIASERQSPSA